MNDVDIMRAIKKDLLDPKAINDRHLPRLYVALPLLFLASFSLALAKSSSELIAEKMASKLGTFIIMVGIALACIAAAFFLAVLIAKKSKQEHPAETRANKLKFLGFIASVVGCIELCILVGDDLFNIHSLNKNISTGLSISASSCFVLATVLLTAGMFFYAYAKAEEKKKSDEHSSSSIWQGLKDKYFILFIFQVVGASAFLIQSFYGISIPNANTSLIQLPKGFTITYNYLVMTFLFLGAISAFGLYHFGVGDYPNQNKRIDMKNHFHRNKRIFGMGNPKQQLVKVENLPPMQGAGVGDLPTILEDRSFTPSLCKVSN